MLLVKLVKINLTCLTNLTNNKNRFKTLFIILRF